MAKRVYCLYDRVAATWVGALVADRADAPVIRMFHDLCNDPKTGPGQHPGDYELRFVGHVGDDGQLLPADDIQTIATGQAFVESRLQAVDA